MRATLGFAALTPALLVALMAACGDSSNPNGGDASADGAADATTDAADAATGPLCDPTKPFGAPTPVAELDTAQHELFARLTPDELTVYFERYASADAGTGGADLYVASRASTSAPFGAPKILSSLHAAANQFDPTPTGDDLTIIFASTRAGGSGGADLWMATRADTASAFGGVTNLTTLDTPNNEHTPYMMADGLTLYFCSEAATAALARATRTSTTSTFALDANNAFAALNAAGNSLGPAVLPDELTLYFASDRSGSSGPLDVWKATRATTSDAFGAPTAVAEVNSTGTDVPTWISDDGCRLYLYSDRDGSYDVYVASKPL